MPRTPVRKKDTSRAPWPPDAASTGASSTRRRPAARREPARTRRLSGGNRRVTGCSHREPFPRKQTRVLFPEAPETTLLYFARTPAAPRDCSMPTNINDFLGPLLGFL